MKTCKRCDKCGLHCISAVLLVIGGLNWGAIGIFGVDVVDSLLGGWPWLVSLVYILVGVSAVLFLIEKHCKKCK